MSFLWHTLRVHRWEVCGNRSRFGDDDNWTVCRRTPSGNCGLRRQWSRRHWRYIQERKQYVVTLLLNFAFPSQLPWHWPFSPLVTAFGVHSSLEIPLNFLLKTWDPWKYFKSLWILTCYPQKWPLLTSLHRLIKISLHRSQLFMTEGYVSCTFIAVSLWYYSIFGRHFHYLKTHT